ncbi:MAG TPA: hypothetical protein VFV88_09925 [Steroidobacteraceae bacterium]|jgi:hypothetical protein|nr:hypothetical protein [Steroidobacteraceae bacterium]
MKIASSILRAGLLMLVAGSATRASEPVLGEELEVVQSLAAIINNDAGQSFDFLYFESDFSTSAHVSSSISNPDRTQFCGVTRVQAQAVVSELQALTSSPVEFDNNVAKPAGLKVGHKKLERFRYLMVSRVIFWPDNQHAWLAVDQNGETGALLRLEKINGQWNKTARCGGWIKS